MSPIDASNIKHNISGWPKDSNSAAECAKECSNRRRCDTIKYDRLTKKCTLLENGKLSKDTSADKAGWCPKGSTNRNKMGAHRTEQNVFFLGRRQHGDREVPTQPVDMMCTNKGSLCQFPYKLRGKVSQFFIPKMSLRDMDTFKKTS